jgi:type II secretory pathway pseudopilin PulG
MRYKNNKCFTLIELVLTFSILAIVTAAVATAVFDNVNSIVVNRKLEDDQYMARLALLAITREAHRGLKATVDPYNVTLSLTDSSNDGVIYSFVDGVLKRDDITTGGDTYDSTIHPIAVELNEVVFRTIDNPNEKNPVDNPDDFNDKGDPENVPDGKWLYIRIKCNGIDGDGDEGLVLKTTISTSRIGTAAEPVTPP